MAEENPDFDEDFENFDQEFREEFIDYVADYHDCRYCKHYLYETSDEVQFIQCFKGYFDYNGGPDETLPEPFACNGEKFRANFNNRWWRARYSSEKDQILEVVRKRLENKHKNKKIESLRDRVINEFDEPYRGIIGNAFDDLMTLTIPPSPYNERVNADYFAAFAFGYDLREHINKDYKSINHNLYNPRYHLPGVSNEAIADVMQRFFAFCSKTELKIEDIFAQWEVADAFSALYEGKRQVGHIAVPSECQSYFGTKGVADIFVEQGLGKGKNKNIVVFAHPLHMYRCVKTLEKSLRNAGSDAKVLIADTRGVPFDKNSIQPWTRDIKSWIIHEISSRAYAREKGDM